jgi:hypothetical protein
MWKMTEIGLGNTNPGGRATKYHRRFSQIEGRFIKGHSQRKGHDSEINQYHRDRSNHRRLCWDGNDRIPNPDQNHRLARKMGSCTDCYDTGQDSVEIPIDPRDRSARMSRNNIPNDRNSENERNATRVHSQFVGHFEPKQPVFTKRD